MYYKCILLATNCLYTYCKRNGYTFCTSHAYLPYLIQQLSFVVLNLGLCKIKTRSSPFSIGSLILAWTSLTTLYFLIFLLLLSSSISPIVHYRYRKDHDEKHEGKMLCSSVEYIFTRFYKYSSQLWYSFLFQFTQSSFQQFG